MVVGVLITLVIILVMALATSAALSALVFMGYPAKFRLGWEAEGSSVLQDLGNRHAVLA